MSAVLKIDFKSLKRTIGKIDETFQGEKRAELLDNLGFGLSISTQERFESKKGPDGKKWKPSKTLKRQKDGTITATTNPNTLIKSARLRDSITHQVAKDSVMVGTNVIYAKTHQFGAHITPKKAAALAIPLGKNHVLLSPAVTIPARPFLGFSKQDKMDLTAQFHLVIKRTLSEKDAS